MHVQRRGRSANSGSLLTAEQVVKTNFYQDMVSGVQQIRGGRLQEATRNFFVRIFEYKHYKLDSEELNPDLRRKYTDMSEHVAADGGLKIFETLWRSADLID